MIFVVVGPTVRENEMPKHSNWRCSEGPIGIFAGSVDLVPKARPAGLSVVISQPELQSVRSQSFGSNHLFLDLDLYRLQERGDYLPMKTS